MDENILPFIFCFSLIKQSTIFLESHEIFGEQNPQTIWRLLNGSNKVFNQNLGNLSKGETYIFSTSLEKKLHNIVFEM